MRNDRDSEELVAALYQDTSADRLLGLMERYNLLDVDALIVADCPEAAETRRPDDEQFVNDALMAYYNRKG